MSSLQIKDCLQDQSTDQSTLRPIQRSIRDCHQNKFTDQSEMVFKTNSQLRDGKHVVMISL